MPAIKYKVALSEQERKKLQTIITKGTHKSQKVLNALVLLNCDEGEFSKCKSKGQDISRMLSVSEMKIHRVKKRFIEEGLEVALNGHKGQRVYMKKADGEFEAHLIAVSCSKPPKGFARWSLRLLADKVVELEYIDKISYETVRRVLKKRNKALEKNRLGNSTREKQ